jgi:hypothetical protein
VAVGGILRGGPGGNVLEHAAGLGELGNAGVDVGEPSLDELVNVPAGWLAGVADVEDLANLVETEPGTLSVADEPDALAVVRLVVPVATGGTPGRGQESFGFPEPKRLGRHPGHVCDLAYPHALDLPADWKVYGTATMDVELLYFDGCPHWEAADARLRQVAGEVGTTVRLRRVEEGDDLTGFGGSPTILLDGQDPFLPAGPSAGGLSCRLFATPDGPAGSPTLEQLRAALGSEGRRA